MVVPFAMAFSGGGQIGARGLSQWSGVHMAFPCCCFLLLQAAAYKLLLSDAPHVAVADHAGSGKTLAYLAPLVQQLRQQEAAAGRPVTQPNRPRLLIVTPTEGTVWRLHCIALLLEKKKPSAKRLAVEVPAPAGQHARWRLKCWYCINCSVSQQLLQMCCSIQKAGKETAVSYVSSVDVIFPLTAGSAGAGSAVRPGHGWAS